MRSLTFLFLMFLSFPLFSQNLSLQGDVLGDQGVPLPSATVVLLNPSDSTMEFFGITNTQGHFELKYLKAGRYLMHVAYLGYQTQYKPVNVPWKDGGDYGVIVLNPKPVNLKEVEVVGEYIPLQIKNDTIEFNARAFKTRPDATVEELLKKLPGIEIDRAGNIKALGKDVRKVLVDGKEFFGNDPKVATKNLPADAVNKVQVYDKRSEVSEFTGIDDGTRDKTVNLVLKDDKKKGLFGDATAGGGTGKHYAGSVKAYRFSDKSQAAVLGMLNNINQTGFSFSDYLSFSGGLTALSGGGGHIVLGDENSFPVNFGTPVTGLTSSGAAGLNYSYSWSKDSRIFCSYIADGSNKRLNETTKTWNYTDEGSFYQEQESNRVQRDTTHRINFGLRYRIDSTRNLIVNGNFSLSNGFSPMNSLSSSYIDNVLINSLSRTSTGGSSSLTGNANGSYVKKFNRNRSVLTLSGRFAYSANESMSRYVNDITYSSANDQSDSRYQNTTSWNRTYSGGVSVNQKIGKKLYLEPEIRFANFRDNYNRELGIPMESDFVIDSLSPDFTRTYSYLKPELSLKRNTDKIQFTARVGMELGRLGSSLWTLPEAERQFAAFTPSLSWENEYKTGRRLSFYYQSGLNIPSISQLMPVVDNTDPLSLMYGNQQLKPEYYHNIFMHWLLFDQFTFTSLFATLNAGFTKDKINWSRIVDDNLVQSMTLTNVDHDFNAAANIDFSTVIRKLGIKVNTSLRENFSRGISLINGMENFNTNLSHRLSLTFDNRKKVKWDVNVGGSLTLTDAWYSIQESLNNRYVDFSCFGEINYNPNDDWHFRLSADVTNYTAESFGQSVSIPLIGAEISYSFLKSNRGVLTLQGVDLLDKNTGIQRVSEMNYLLERQSNTIGRYVILSFKYRLNKLGSNKPSVDIEIKN